LHVVRVELAGTDATPRQTDLALSGTWTPVYDESQFPWWIKSVVFDPGTRKFTVSVENNEDKAGGVDIVRDYAFVVGDGTEDRYEVIVYQDKRWWLGVSNVTGWNADNANKMPAPNLNLIDYSSNRTNYRGIDTYINGQYNSSSPGLPGRQAPPYDPLTTGVITLTFNGTTGLLGTNPPSAQVVTLQGWLGGKSIGSTTWWCMYTAGNTGNIDPAPNATYTTIGTGLSTLTVSIRPTTATLPRTNRKYFEVVISADPAWSTYKFYIYATQYF